MYRALEVLSGIGVFLLCLQGLAALFQCTQKVPRVSILAVSIYGAILLFSFVGAFILLSWAKKPK
jgi:hypothetical protein